MKTNPTMLLTIQIRGLNLPRPEYEFRFAPPRRFRFDLCWKERLIAVEVDGGGWIRGRHHRPKGHASDCEKRNLATELGWDVYTYVPEQIESGEAVRQIQRVLAAAEFRTPGNSPRRGEPSCEPAVRARLSVDSQRSV